MSKFLLILGPSGVGKSSIIHNLCERDQRFVYISPYITRPLREGEKDKISITDAEMDHMDASDKLLAINRLYGIRYATPRVPIAEALDAGQFPILDWPISKLKVMSQAFPKLHIVYIAPPSLETLTERLSRDERGGNSSRLQMAIEEFRLYQEDDQFTAACDLTVVSHEGEIEAIAGQIYAHYLAAVAMQSKQSETFHK